MDGKLSRSAIIRKKDPHDWNSYDHYCAIHEKRLAEHPFVDESQPSTLGFRFLKTRSGLWLQQSGSIFCNSQVTLDVGKLFETRHKGTVLQVRGLLYRYVAWTKNKYLILKYHNLHENHDEYIHRIFDPTTGRQTLFEILTRHQFPTFAEVLDEIEYLVSARM